MSLLFRMAWRNLFRNRRRTFLTATIIAMGLMSLILMDAVMTGMVSNMVATATDTFLGQAQVHAKGFRAEKKVEWTVDHLPEVEATLSRDPSVAAFVERTLAVAMVGSASDAESVLLYGIDPGKELSLSQIHRAVLRGRHLTAADKDGILLGERLARVLQVHVGDRVVLTVAKAHTGELAQEMTRVTGIFSFGSKEMDRRLAFIPLARSQELLGVKGSIHEVAFRFKKGDGSEKDRQALYESLTLGGNETCPWTTLMPEIKSTLDITGFATWLIAFLLAGLVALSTLNTQFMSVYERMFEFGVLRALGTHPMGLAFLVVLEAARLGFLSVLLGMALGASLTYALSQIGIDYSGIEYAGVTFQPAIFPQWRPLPYPWLPRGGWCFTVLIACYPAAHVYRLLPAKAMRRSLG